MKEYFVTREFDVMDMFDELPKNDQLEFINNTIYGLDYGDDLHVVKEAAQMLDDVQKQELIEEAFDNIEDENKRLGTIYDLVGNLSGKAQEQLIEYLTNK